VPPRAHRQHERRTLEVDLLPQLVLQIALVGEVQIDVVVEREHDGGGRHADLGGEEDRHRLVALGRLRRMGLGRLRDQAVELAGRDTPPARVLDTPRRGQQLAHPEPAAGRDEDNGNIGQELEPIAQLLLEGFPLQLALAYAALANGGELLQPHIIKEIRSTDGAVLYEAKRRVLRKVFSERVSNQVRELLRSVVDSGTAVKADLAAFEVAGKSGTARRTEKGRGYVAGNYTVSFVGLFPAEKPQYVVLVKLDSPKRSYFGGEVAAPVTSVVLRAALAARNAALDRGELASVEQDVPLAPSESTAAAVMPGDTSATITGQAVLAPVAEPLAGPPKIFLLPYEKRRAIVDKALRPVPDVRGLPVRSAVRALHRAGFRVTLATTIGVPTLPVAGTLLAPGSIVKLQHIP